MGERAQHWLFQRLSMLWLLLEAVHCQLTPTERERHDKQEWEDSCKLYLLTPGLIWITTHMTASRVRYIRMGFTFGGQMQEVAWATAAGIMGKVCVQFYITNKVSVQQVHHRLSLWLNRCQKWAERDKLIFFFSVRLSSMRTKTLVVVTTSAWVTALTCTPCLIAAAPSGWRVACSWSMTDLATLETSTSWGEENTQTTWARVA